MTILELRSAETVDGGGPPSVGPGSTPLPQVVGSFRLRPTQIAPSPVLVLPRKPSLVRAILQRSHSAGPIGIQHGPQWGLVSNAPPTPENETPPIGGGARQQWQQLARKKSTISLARRQTTVTTEIRAEYELVKRNMFSRKPWIDGLHVMKIVVANTITTVAVAWAVMFVYAVGPPMAPAYPSGSATFATIVANHYAAAIGSYFVLFGCLAYAVTAAYQESELMGSFHSPTTQTPFRTALGRVLSGSLHVLLLLCVVGGGLMELLHQCGVDFQPYGRLHVCLLCALLALFIDFTATRSRRRHRVAIEPPPDLSQRSDRSTITELPQLGERRRESQTNVSRPRPPSRWWWQRVDQRTLLHFAFANAAFIYLHLSNSLNLTQPWEITIYAAFSLLFKITLQETTKKYQLDAKRTPSARVVHRTMTIPTIAIDAHIRIVFVQMGVSQSSSSLVGSSIALVVCEVLFRLAKIFRLRHTIQSRLGKSRGMQRILRRVNSKVALRDIAIARAEYSQFLDWKNYMLRLHAAEVYADMHGEYISIGLSMAVVYFLNDHPMYAIGRANASTQRQMLSAVFQLTTGLLFDYISSVFEGIHEVPLYESIGDEGTGLRVFIHVLLAALTTVNGGIIALFFLRSHPRA